MGATTDRLLEELEQSTSRTTSALKELVRSSGNRIEKLTTQQRQLEREFPKTIYGTVIGVTMGMNGMPEPALQLEIESMVSMRSTRRFTGFIVNQKLSGPAALRFISECRVEDTADFKGKCIKLSFDEDERRYDAFLIEELPIGFSREADAVFVGSRIEFRDDSDIIVSGTLIRRGEDEGYVEVKRDDGRSGGGQNGDYITYIDDITKVL